jgi:hypothetical protein
MDEDNWTCPGLITAGGDEYGTEALSGWCKCNACWTRFLALETHIIICMERMQIIRAWAFILGEKQAICLVQHILYDEKLCFLKVQIKMNDDISVFGQLQFGSFRGVNGSGRVEFGSCHIILFFLSDPNSIWLNLDQKILIHIRPDGSQNDPTRPV